MILTRSIRRKLVIGLAIVFAMVLLLTIAGLSALYAYHGAIEAIRTRRDDEPHRADLAKAFESLTEPLVHLENERVNELIKKHIDENISRVQRPEKITGPNGEVSPLKPIDRWKLYEPDTLILHQTMWDERRKKVADKLTEFYRRWELSSRGKESTRLYNVQSSMLKSIQNKLELLDSKRGCTDCDDHGQLVFSMMFDVIDLQNLINDFPEGVSSIDSTLHNSWDVLEWRLWLIGVPTTIVLILFFGLIYFGYRWILVPISQLYEAAARVGQGDYSYRIKIFGRDEMAVLGQLFNKMTERFQTDKTKLAKEVDERSRQLVRNERLASIGFFASGVAHEINNPLHAIGAAAESLNEQLGSRSLGNELSDSDRELLLNYLEMIERESTRCQQITARVLDFARGTNAPKTRHNLTEIVNEVLEMVRHMSKFDGHTIIFDKNTPHFVDVCPAEIKQVILNLVANGLEAITGKGTLSIYIDETFDEVILNVQDNGCGMTAQVIENLYEPFFTEKPNGKGTGLGLSITNRIVGDHGGRIEATSDGPGKGSTFRVHLPRIADPAKISAA